MDAVNKRIDEEDYELGKNYAEGEAASAF